MTDICKLKGILPSEVKGLREIEVKTVEELWWRVAKGMDEMNLLAKQAGMEEARLLHLLVVEGLRDSKRLGNSRLKRHWFDLLLVAGIIALIVLIVRAVRP